MAATQQTNGKAKRPPAAFQNGWLDQLDGRYDLTRELRDRYAAMTADMGGIESMSYAQRSLAERALWLEYWLASQERALAAGEPFDVGRWTQAVNALQGIYTKLGLKRRTAEPKDLSQFLQERAEAADG